MQAVNRCYCTFDPAVSRADKIRVRFLNASAGTLPVNVTVDGNEIVTGLYFTAVTEFVSQPAGLRYITVTDSTSPGSVLMRRAVLFPSGQNITLVLRGYPGQMDYSIIPEAGCPTAGDSACIRVVHMSPNTPAVDVELASGTPIFDDITYREVTPYKLIEAGSYTMLVKLSETMPHPQSRLLTDSDIAALPDRTPLLSFTVDIGRATAYTVYIVGYREGSPALEALLVEY